MIYRSRIRVSICRRCTLALFIKITFGIFIAAALASAEDASVAPPNLANKIVGISSIGGSFIHDNVYLFNADGSYEKLFSRSEGSPFVVWGGAESGSFEYIPNESDNSATLVLMAEDGARISETIEFSTSTLGKIPNPFVPPTVRVADLYQDLPVVNTSVNGELESNERLTAGFVVREGRYFLIRAVGPTLGEYGLDGVNELNSSIIRGEELVGQLQDMVASVFPGDSARRVESLLGAFPLKEGSSDKLWFGVLTPGVYLVEAINSGSVSGNLLIEVYTFPL